MNKGFVLTFSSDKDLVCQDNITERIFKIAIQAPASTVKKVRPPMNISIIIDRSGSMSGGKLVYARHAASHAVRLLNEHDHVSIVSFDQSVTLVSPSLPATPANKVFMLEKIDDIREGGSTNLSGGWLKGCQTIAETQQAGHLCRAILLTDGQANAGITDIDELARHAAEIAERGISTSTFGIGEGFNEHLLEAVSNHGRGNFHYIAEAQQVPQLFERELGELGEIMLKNIDLELLVPFGYNFRVLGSYIHSSQGNKVNIKINDLFAQAVEEVFVIATVNNQPNISSIGCVATIKGLDIDSQLFSMNVEHPLTFATQDEVDSARSVPELMARFAEVKLSDLQKEGLLLERQGKGPEAAKILMETTMMYAPMIGSDRVAYYSHIADRMKANNLRESEHKLFHQEQYQNKRGRKW